MGASKQKITEHCNIQFYQALNSKARYRVFVGGSRSGKTIGITQYLIYLITTSKTPLTISIVRATLPSLKRSVMRDFIDLIQKLGIYDLGVFNKTENIFTYNKHKIEFFSLDDAQKIKGSKRDICYFCEIDECGYDEFQQIIMRTTGHIICCFNPSEPVHFIYDLMDDKDMPGGVDVFHSTYKDNYFLEPSVVQQIESMKERNPDMWRIYGEGQRAMISNKQIFTNWEFMPRSEFPEFDDMFLSCDFGFSIDSCCIIEFAKVKDKIYVHELLYETGYTNGDIANFLRDKKIQNRILYYDSAEPKSGEDLKRLGILAKPAIKGAGSVSAGISLLKDYKIILSKESKNAIKEYYSYCWDELKDGTLINKPKPNQPDHFCDALRYGVYTRYRKQTEFFVV
tara:strand:+ start:102 stop:1292 length:1191 start_codon:yes stop_codon:yes gene_type:complete